MQLCHLHAESFWSHARTVGRSVFGFLTDPMPESATESLQESVVCVLLLASESVFSVLPPAGQSILAVIWLVLLVSLNAGVTVMLGTRLSSCPLSAGMDGLDLDIEDWRTKLEENFGTCPVPEEVLCNKPKEELWSGPENLVIKFLILLARCRYELRERPEGGFFSLALLPCSASSLLVVWWELSGEWEEEDSDAWWKRRIPKKKNC